MEKIFKITLFSNTYEVKLNWGVYAVNGTLALMLNSKISDNDIEYFAQEIAEAGDLFVEPFGVITVNLPESVNLPNDVQFVDTNNLPGIDKWLVENNIATPTEIIAKSGFCTYQAYKFNAPEEAIQKIMKQKKKI